MDQNVATDSWDQGRLSETCLKVLVNEIWGVKY